MKKILLIILILIFMCSCTNKKDESQACDLFEECGGETTISVHDFKIDYESINGLKNKKDVYYRILNIPEDNPIVYTSGEEIINLINNKESFYLYVGDKLCPWCRSNIETAIKIAKENNIEKIYYIEIWDDEGNEIFRDKYQIEDDKLVQVYKGEASYHQLLEYSSSFLKDYVLNKDGENIEVGEKRIFAPSYFYFEEGVLKRFTEGTSINQKDAYETLNDQILNDQETLFKELFSEE